MNDVLYRGDSAVLSAQRAPAAPVSAVVTLSAGALMSVWHAGRLPPPDLHQRPQTAV